MVPGHEILGRVVKVGAKVTNFKAGDLAGIGCLVDSCRECKNCKNSHNNVCSTGAAMTYNGFEMDKKTPTYGGYSTQIVVDHDHVIKVPSSLTKLEAVAPLFCAGITTFSPMRRYQDKVTKGTKVAIVGLGGLGHMGVKFAASMGAEVTVLSTSISKEKDAKALGAHHFVVSKDIDAMKKLNGTFDFILDTVSADHDIQILVDSLATFGVIVLVGAPSKPFTMSAFSLLMQNKTIAGSLIGGIKETQEMIDYCGAHGIVSEVEVIPVQKVEEAYERTLKADVKYRFVIDINTLKQL
jgi:uncharacterized zinc-type alcohol dehydrogenase-like protein